MALIDEVKIQVCAGDGGNGCRSFRREKYVPYGGPNGGNGGRGGNIILQANRNKSSLLDFKYRPLYKGNRGEHGMGSDCDGRGGEDKIIEVPLGTLVYAPDGDLLEDLNQDGKAIMVAKGGDGGRGNKSFATSTNRAPQTATPGYPGEQTGLRLELRLFADVGLIGLPNAGKSSFLSVISKATPKVASYPFTTLEPHLGVCYHADQSWVVADLPGLIEGAAAGAGLGHRFLKHIMRNRVLLHLVSLEYPFEEIMQGISTIVDELKNYDDQLIQKPRYLVFTKCDLLEPAALAEMKSKLHSADLDGYFISSHAGLGMTDLLNFLAKKQLETNLDS